MSKCKIFAFSAGICASIAGIFGKLSGNEEINIYAKVTCIIVMLLLNASMWTFYSKALNLSETSIIPTVISSAVNFIFSGVMGVVLFRETTSLLWWSGVCMIIFGLVFITRSNQSKEDIHYNKND